MTRDDATRELQAITAALADRLTIVHTIINPDGSVVGTYRKTVRIPRDPQTGPHHSGG
jgi:hypothetical protein